MASNIFFCDLSCISYKVSRLQPPLLRFLHDHRCLAHHCPPASSWLPSSASSSSMASTQSLLRNLTIFSMCSGQQVVLHPAPSKYSRSTLMNNTSPVAFRQLATAAIGAVLHLLAQYQDAAGNINAIEQVGGDADAAALKKSLPSEISVDFGQIAEPPPGSWRYVSRMSPAVIGRASGCWLQAMHQRPEGGIGIDIDAEPLGI